MNDGQRLGVVGAVADLALTAILTFFLVGLAVGHLDAVPRPVALFALYATPGVIGAIGAARERRSLLAAAALVLVPGSVLSMAGVTLVFALPMVLFAAAAAAMGGRGAGVVVEAIETVVIATLVVAAGAALLVLTANTCATSDGATACGSGLITLQGVVAELALLASAVGFAAWRGGLARRRGGAAS